MTVPLFPLQSVFFPGETVPLHIFEERYKQLIADCRERSITFGIPVFIRDSLDYGTEVQLRDVVNTYADGSMDVVCVARQVFRVVRFRPVLEGRLYPGGEVRFLDIRNSADPGLNESVYQACKHLYDLMELPFEPGPREVFNSFTLAHKMGLSFEQEYELLRMPDESDRLRFILEHLERTSRVVGELNRTRERIEMNGHFRNFDPLDFEDFKIE